MQWSHIKTLFIFSFLILNIYLLYQFIDRQEQYDIPSLSDNDQSLEEELERDNIEITADLNQEAPDLSYISVSQRLFGSDEVDGLNNLDGLDAVTNLDNNLIFAQFEEPLELPEEEIGVEMFQNAISPYVIGADQYEYGTWNENLNIIVFFQTKGGYPIYLNRQALLLFYVNEDNEITHYTQTMLGEEEKQGDRSIIQPFNAVGYLYNSSGNYLRRDHKINNIDLGYYSRIEPEEAGGELVFAPTWKVTVDHSQDYFVNGVEGLVYPGDYTEYLVGELRDNYLVQANQLNEENDVRNSMIQVIEGKLEQLGSEVE